MNAERQVCFCRMYVLHLTFEILLATDSILSTWFPRLVLCFFSGFLAPGVKPVLCNPAGSDPGKALLVLPAVNLECLVVTLALLPNLERTNLRAGASLLIKGPVTVFSTTMSSHSKQLPTVFAHSHFDLPLQALMEMIVDQIIHCIWVQDLREDFLIQKLVTHPLGPKMKQLPPRPLCRKVAGGHFYALM